MAITVTQAIAWIDSHATKLLGLATLVVSSALIVPELIPAAHMKYWLFANALLGGSTVGRGYVTAKRFDAAKGGP